MNRQYPTLARLGPALACAFLALMASSVDRAVRATPEHGSAEWTQLRADAPLAGHSAVLTPSGKLVLHGGERELNMAPETMRQLDISGPNGAWSTLQVSGDAPAARLVGRGLPGSRAIVDPTEGLLLTVCDCTGGSTFLLDLASGRWSHAPNDAGLPYWFSLLAYDAPRDRAILYGGQQYGLGDQVSDKGWSYDLSAARSGWHSVPDAPFKIVYQAADVDPGSGHLLAFGGLDAEGTVMAGLWRLDLASADEPGAWRDITSLAGAGPSARIGATLTFDPATSQAVLYGGLTTSGDLDDVWLLDYSDPSRPTWSQVEQHEPNPGARSGHSAAWDPISKRTLIYGGTELDDLTGTARYLDDAWALEVGEAEPSPTPPPTKSPPSPTTPPPEPKVYLPIGYNGTAVTDP